MNYTLTYDRDRDLIVGCVQGAIDSALVSALASELAGLAAATGCRRVLNDLRQARLSGDVFDIYTMPEIVSKRGVPLRCKRALLVAASSEEFRFFETVSVNACQQVRIFSERQQALAWLGVAQVW